MGGLVIGLASRTGSAKNIAALKAAGWGWIVGPLDKNGARMHGMPYAIDNGAWPAFANGTEWNADAFVKTVHRFGEEALFIVIPDVVADRDASLEQSRKWLPRLQAIDAIRNVPLLLAAQDGLEFADAEPFLEDPRVGIFVGGSCEWKVPAIVPWCRFAKARGRYAHVGRVNSARRIALCAAGNADSFDGTSATRFSSTVPLLDGARRQPALL